MFVKIYQYHIPKEKVEEFLDIQEKAAALYGRYLDYHTMYLNSKEDETKWMEISRYKDKHEYHRRMDLVNEQEEIHRLFKVFDSLLVGNKREIGEEEYIEMKNISFRNRVKEE